jgi:hypothetical protein
MIETREKPDVLPLALSRDAGECLSELSVPIIVESPAVLTSSQPVTTGIPFPRGAILDPRILHLVDRGGNPLPLQATALAHWPGGSVKWLLLDTILPPGTEPESACQLYADTEAERRDSCEIQIVERNSAIIVDTRAASFELETGVLKPLSQVWVAGRPLLNPGGVQTLLTDRKGRVGRPVIERVTVEDRGPVRATVRLDGQFRGATRCRFVARVCFFAGTGVVRIRLSIHNPRRARHRGGLWDLGDPGSVFFRELSLSLGLALPEPRRLAWKAEPGQALRDNEPNHLEIYQDSSGGVNWRSSNHVNREGRIPCTFRGYRTRAGGTETFGLRANPVVSLHSDHASIAAAIPEFWQQFPKAIEVDGTTVTLGLFPRQFADLFELQGGERKTHAVWLAFSSSELAGYSDLDWVHCPAGIRAVPDWYASSSAIPFLSSDGPIDKSWVGALLDDAIEGPTSLFARREAIDEYGWRNYGEIYADHEGAFFSGTPPVISHYNNQYDFIFGSLLQHMRTGRPQWIEIADALGRHVVDIDIYQTGEDRSEYNHGLFWHTDHYRDAATCTHRTFSRANRTLGGRRCGGGPCNEHNYTTGLLYVYYCTGNRDAREAVLSLANWVVDMDDGVTSLMSLLDDGPTGQASRTYERDYHGPGRGCGNSINALMDGWLLSGSRHYLDKAEALILRSVHPDEDPARHNLLDVERRWSYTVFLSALARYLGLKAEMNELDAHYAYGRESLLNYATWMLENERPYFDHPDDLEYPTETWAAQDLRKANVLRLAAAHSDGPLRDRLLARGEELANRAWSDLSRFESRGVARALAIVMIEATRDDFFRRNAKVPSAPRPRSVTHYGEHETFVPRRSRIVRRLKTLSGLVWQLFRLATPSNWKNYLSRKGSKRTGATSGGKIIAL